MSSSKYEFIHNVALDSCSFDASDPVEEKACAQILKLVEDRVVIPTIPHSVMKEIDHPNTPVWKKKKAGEMVFTYDLGLNPEQKSRLESLKKIIAGKGKSEKFESDALHILIAEDSQEYFITADNRLIAKRKEIESFLPGVRICKPSEFIKIIEEDKTQYVKRQEWRRQKGLPPC